MPNAGVIDDFGGHCRKVHLGNIVLRSRQKHICQSLTQFVGFRQLSVGLGHIVNTYGDSLIMGFRRNLCFKIEFLTDTLSHRQIGIYKGICIGGCKILFRHRLSLVVQRTQIASALNRKYHILQILCGFRGDIGKIHRYCKIRLADIALGNKSVFCGVQFQPYRSGQVDRHRIGRRGLVVGEHTVITVYRRRGTARNASQIIVECIRTVCG